MASRFISCSANSNTRWDDCPRTQIEVTHPDSLRTVLTELSNFHFLNTPPRIYFNVFIPLPKLELYENAFQWRNVFRNACFAFKLGRKTFQTLGVFSQRCVVKLKCVRAGDMSAVFFLAQTGKKNTLYDQSTFYPSEQILYKRYNNCWDRHSVKNCLIRGVRTLFPAIKLCLNKNGIPFIF